MDEEYHCGLFNRLPVYYGRDLYDTEDTDEFDPDVQEIMDFVNYAHNRPEGGETRGVDTVEMLYMCLCQGTNLGLRTSPTYHWKRTLLILRKEILQDLVDVRNLGRERTPRHPVTNYM